MRADQLTTKRKCVNCGEFRPLVDFGDYNPYKCNPCHIREFKEARDALIAALKGKPVEERLERIEKILYDMTTHKPWKRHFRPHLPEKF